MTISPNEVTAWIQVAQVLVGAGLQVGKTIQGWIAQSHPTATPEETHAVYVAIMADDTVRAALATLASRPDPSEPGA